MRMIKVIAKCDNKKAESRGPFCECCVGLDYKKRHKKNLAKWSDNRHHRRELKQQKYVCTDVSLWLRHNINAIRLHSHSIFPTFVYQIPCHLPYLYSFVRISFHPNGCIHILCKRFFLCPKKWEWTCKYSWVLDCLSVIMIWLADLDVYFVVAMLLWLKWQIACTLS